MKTLDIWQQLFKRGIMQEGAVGYQQYPDANNDFLTGKYAMVMMGTWYTQYSTEKAMTAALKAAGVSGAKPFPISPVQFPDVAQAGNTGEMFGDADYGLAVSTKAKNKAAAETFVTWMTTSKVGQQAVADQLNDVPALKGIEPNFDKITFVDPAAAGGSGEGPARQGRHRHRASLRAAEPGRPGRDLPGGDLDGHRQGDPRGGGEHAAAVGRGGGQVTLEQRQISDKGCGDDRNIGS